MSVLLSTLRETIAKHFAQVSRFFARTFSYELERKGIARINMKLFGDFLKRNMHIFDSRAIPGVGDL